MKKLIFSQIILLLCVFSVFAQVEQTLDERIAEAINKNLPEWKPKNATSTFDFIRGTYGTSIESDWISSARGANLKIYLLRSTDEIENHFQSFLMRGVIPPNRKIENLGERAHLVETASKVEIKFVKANVIAILETTFRDSRQDKKLPYYYAPAPKEEVEKALKLARVVADAIARERTFSLCFNDFYRQKFPAPASLEEELRVAVRSGETETVKSLLGKNVNVNHIFSDGETLLHIAVRQGCAETVKTLIAAQADPNAKNAKGTTPLMIAANYGDLELAKLLIGAGADVHVKDVYGRNAAFSVISMVQGVRQGFPPASIGDKTELIKYLAAQGLNLNEKDTLEGDTILTMLLYDCYASPACGKTMINLLLDLGADINAENKHGRTALINSVDRINAAVQGEFVSLLLERGANPNHKDKKNLSALDYALKEQKLYNNDPVFSKHVAATVKLLKDAGAIE